MKTLKGISLLLGVAMGMFLATAAFLQLAFNLPLLLLQAAKFVGLLH